MAAVVILQREVAHYRAPLFERLFSEFGWVVATSKAPPASQQERLTTAPYIIPFKFRFLSKSNPYRTIVPMGEILRRTRAKCVIAEFSMHMSSSYDLVLRRRLLGRPIVLFWSHGFNMDRGLFGLRAKMIQRARVFLAKRADGHICYSNEGAAYLSRFLDESKVFVARNTSITTTNISDAPHAHPGLSPHILFVGRLTSDKNVPMLIRIFRRIRANFPGAVLTIVGDGPDACKARQTAGEMLGTSVLMPGAVYDPPRLSSYYGAADLFVMAGAAGLSVNQALAEGVPVVLFERTRRGPGHHPEHAYVKPNITGWRVHPFSENAMTAALVEILSGNVSPKDSFRNSLKEFVESNLLIDTMVDDFRIVQTYLETLGATT